MTRALRMKNPAAIMLAIILMIVSALPAAAAETAKQVEVRIKVGSNSMSINGEKITIQSPYNIGKIAMAPLSVFTNAKGFGATVKPVNKNIQITYLKHTVTITKNSAAATVDGKKATLPVAPVDKSQVTMAPVEAIAKALGIKLTTDTKTKEIVLKGTGAAPVSTADNSIDSDAGKSKIGDSHYGWSMNYPTGLVQSYQSPDGDLLEFKDVQKGYYLGIFTEAASTKLTPEEIRTSIYKYYEDTEKTMDKKTVVLPDKTYEKVVSKDKNGFFYEYRGIQVNNYLYIVVFAKKATNAAELDRYKSVLDSFKTSFNKLDSTLKDLTQIIEGYKTFKDEDYGLSVKLPKEWEADEKSANPWYSTEEAYMTFKVTTALPGDTLDAWFTRKRQSFEQSFAPKYSKVLEQKDAVWNGVPAKVLKVAYSMDTELWWEEYEIFAVKGKYHYYTEMAYYDTKKQQYANLLDTVLKTAKVDFAVVEKNFGEITDDSDVLNPETKVMKSSQKYGYHVNLPQYWTGVDKNFEAESIYYTFFGGQFGVDVYDNFASWEELVPEIDDMINQQLKDNPKLRLIENSNVTFAGLTAKKIVKEDLTNRDIRPFRHTVYYVWKDGKYYAVWGLNYLTNSSDFLTKQLEAAIHSFTFGTP